jgi:hypothetical protein
MTPEQEKALHDALGPVLFINRGPDTQQPKARSDAEVIIACCNIIREKRRGEPRGPIC